MIRTIVQKLMKRSYFKVFIDGYRTSKLPRPKKLNKREEQLTKQMTLMLLCCERIPLKRTLKSRTRRMRRTTKWRWKNQ